MPYNGSGIFVRLYNWVTDRANNIDVSADRTDAEMDGMATGLSTCITKDGQQTITNDIPWANHKITGLKTGTVRTDAANVGQVQDSVAQWSGTTGGTANAITVSTSPAITAYAAGQVVRFTATNNNTGATTIAWSGLTAKAAQWGGAAMVGGEIVTGRTYEAIYDGTNFQVMGITTATPSFGDMITQTSTDAGAGAAPTLEQYRNSASPAASDIIGNWKLTGQNSTPAKVTYADIQGQIIDPTAASEDSAWNFQTMVAGTLATRMSVAQGTYMAGATGGDKGAGTINATGIYANGNQISVAPGITGWLMSAISGNSTTASITISAGRGSDSTGAVSLSVTGGTWLVSNGNAINGYQGGTTLPNGSTIHMFAVFGTSGSGYFASLSATAPTLPSGYTFFVRIGSFNTTGAGAPIPFTEIETEGGAVICYLTTQVQDISTSALTTSRTLFTLNVPSGIRVEPKMRIVSSTNAVLVLFTSPDETDVAPSNALSAPQFDIQGGSTSASVFTGTLTTNTSGQIGARSNTSSTALGGTTRGWKDWRR
jgi:hypothetical protein